MLELVDRFDVVVRGYYLNIEYLLGIFLLGCGLGLRVFGGFFGFYF